MAPLPDCAQSVQIVTSFLYLGIQVTHNPSQYKELNLIPLLRKFRDKCTTWCKLPLSVVGRINHIKRVWAPQLFYVFNNSPVWIQRSRFARIDSLFRELIWCKIAARISLSTLQYGKDQGGMAVPHSRAYYLSSLLQQLAGWGHVDPLDPITNIIIPHGAGDFALTHLEAGF